MRAMRRTFELIWEESLSSLLSNWTRLQRYSHSFHQSRTIAANTTEWTATVVLEAQYSAKLVFYSTLSQSLCFSLQKTEFLCLFGLTTISKRDELLERKRRKRRMMLLEGVPSPSAVPSKRKTPSPPQPPLSTRFTPEEMDRTEELDDKKHFLGIFSLSHVSQEERQSTYTHTDTDTDKHTHTHARAHARAHTHAHTHIHTRTHTCTRTHRHRHTQAHTHTHTCAHTHTHTCAHTHTHAHAYTHTHTHTHMDMLAHTHTPNTVTVTLPVKLKRLENYT